MSKVKVLITDNKSLENTNDINVIKIKKAIKEKQKVIDNNSDVLK